MDRKKVARRVAIAFLSLMIFFTFASKTIIYFTTPQVVTTQVTSGQIDNSDTLSNVTFQYSDQKDIGFDKAYDQSLAVTVKSIDVSVGDSVTAGQVVATMDTSALANQLPTLKAAADKAKYAVDDFRTQYANEIQDQTNTINDLTNTINSENQQIVDLQTGKAQPTGGNDLATLQQKVNQDTITLARDKQNLATQESRGTDSNGDTLESIRAAYTTAEQSYNDANNVVNNCTEIKSSGTGKVSNIVVQQGAQYSGAGPVIQLIQSNTPSEILAQVDQDKVEQLKKDTATNKDVKIVLYGDQQLNGTVDKIDSSNGQNYIYVIPKTPNSFVGAKESDVSVKVLKKSVNYDAIIPVSALFEDQYVYVVQKGQGFMSSGYVVKKVTVKTGEANTTSIGITDGLSGNETVVTGTDRDLQNNQAVIKSTS